MQNLLVVKRLENPGKNPSVEFSNQPDCNYQFNAICNDNSERN